jgi:methionine synthase II (cobalamin-independent)
VSETFLKILKHDIEVYLHLCVNNITILPLNLVASEISFVLNPLGQSIYLEYDTEGAGGFESLKELPRGKNVILGLITSKSLELVNINKIKKKVY